jgi:hypothetical protein
MCVEMYHRSIVTGENCMLCDYALRVFIGPTQHDATLYNYYKVNFIHT